MTCKVLTEDRWKKLLQDKLTAEESLEIYDHLDTDCPDCEAFIARMSIDEEAGLSKIHDELSRQDIVTMKVHSGVAVLDLPGPALPVIDVKNWNTPIVGLSNHLTSWFGGIAALLLISVGILPQLYLNQPELSGLAPAELTKTKGITIPENAFKLDFSTGHRQTDGRLVVERGLTGKDYKSNDILFFQYETSVSGYLYLIGITHDASAELLYPLKDDSVKRIQPGESSLSTNGEVIAYPLAGLRGRYAVVGIFSPDPLDMDKQAIYIVQHSVNSLTGEVNKKSIKSIGRNIAIDMIHFDIGT